MPATSQSYTTTTTLTEKDFADRLRLSVRAFRKLAREGHVPAPINPTARHTSYVWLIGTVDSFIRGDYRGPVAFMPPPQMFPSVERRPRRVGRPARRDLTPSNQSLTAPVVPAEGEQSEAGAAHTREYRLFVYSDGRVELLPL
jgi:hypothetical protein